MNRTGIVISAILLGATLCYGQGSSSAPAQAAPAAASHGAFPVRVTRTLDSSKLKNGDAVEVETSGGFKLADGTLVPKGSKLTGHVIEAKSRSKGDAESQLKVAFDKLNVANGKQLAVTGMIQAVFPPADEVDPGVAGAATAHGGGGSGLTAGSPPPPDYRPMTEVKTGSNTGSGSQAEPAMNPRSVGVQGMDNLQLEDGILSSKGKNVTLGSGVRMIVRVDILG